MVILSPPPAKEIILDLPHVGVVKKISDPTIHLDGYSVGDTVKAEGKSAVISSLCNNTRNAEVNFIEEVPTSGVRKIKKLDSKIVNVCNIEPYFFTVRGLQTFKRNSRKKVFSCLFGEKSDPGLYRAEMIKDRIIKNVQSLIKSRRKNSTKVILDLLPGDIKIFPRSILNKKINLNEDRNALNCLKRLWGNYWVVGNRQLCTSGRVFQYVKNVRISTVEESFILTIKMEKADYLSSFDPSFLNN